MIESAVTDLPQPDSPTIPSVLPFSTAKLTPSTARTTPSRVKKCVRRSSTSSSAIATLSLRPRVERVAEAVGDEVRAQDERGDRDRRDDDDAGACGRRRGPPAAIAPQEASGGLMPSPMKERNASPRITPGSSRKTR